MMCAPKTEQIISRFYCAFTSLCVFVVHYFYSNLYCCCQSNNFKIYERKKTQQVQNSSWEVLRSNVTCFNELEYSFQDRFYIFIVLRTYEECNLIRIRYAILVSQKVKFMIEN